MAPTAVVRRAIAVAVAVVLVGLGFAAGEQVAQQYGTTSAQAGLDRAESHSDIGVALARTRRADDLPLGYQPGPDLPFPGDSYRLLYDQDAGAPSTTARWRVWVGEGDDTHQLCIAAAFDSTRSLTDCFDRDQLYTGTFTIASPVGSAPLAIRLVRGDVSVNGRS